jgi:hypothetical protein
VCACEQEILGESSMYRPVFDTDTHHVLIGSVMVLSQNQVGTTGAIVGADPLIAVSGSPALSVQKTPENNPDDCSSQTKAKLVGLWFVLAGILAGICYGLYLLAVFWWCEFTNASATDYCIDRGFDPSV